MSSKTIQVKILRSNPDTTQPATFQIYTVPLNQDLSVLDVLDYIFETMDNSLAYFKHAECNQGICKRCGMKVNGKPVLACITPVAGDIVLTPLNNNVIRDLVVHSRK